MRLPARNASKLIGSALTLRSPARCRHLVTVACAAYSTSGQRCVGANVERLQRDHLAAAVQRLAADLDEAELAMEALRSRVGWLQIELAGDHRKPLAPGERKGIAVQRAARTARLDAAGDH